MNAVQAEVSLMLNSVLNITCHFYCSLITCQSYCYVTQMTCSVTDCQGLLLSFFSPSFPTQILYACLVWPSGSTCSVYLIALNIINRIIFDVVYKLRHYSVVSNPLFFPRLNILFITLFSGTLAFVWPTISFRGWN